MNSLKRIFFIITLFSTSILLGQTIKGTVTDGSLPIPGVNISVKGTAKGVITDFDGNYTIEDVNKNEILVFSSIGFVTKEVVVTDKSTINIKLEEDVTSLEEVVVVGYGTQKKSTISTAIETVTAEEISEIPAADIAQTLQGRTAGVTISKSGSPGERTAVRIRGINTFNDGDPLYVVDGVFTTNINSLSPSSIEKIDVLKDAASTAIYGSRGANGVIIVTTKTGKKGKTSFYFNTSYGLQESNERYDLLNTEQFIQYAKEINAQGVANGGTDVNFLNQDPNFDGNGVDTDWQEALFRTAYQKNYDFGANGGTEKTKYAFSFSAFDQDGIYIDTNFKRYSFNTNNETKVNNRFKIGQTLSLGYTETKVPEVEGGRVLIHNIIGSSPFTPVYDEDGNFFTGNDENGNDSRNPIATQLTRDNLRRNTNVLGSLYAEVELIKGLTFRSQFALNANYAMQDDIQRAFETTGDFGVGLTTIEKERDNDLATTFTQTLNYAKSIGGHNLNLTLVSERLDGKEENLAGSEQGDVTNEIDQFTTEATATSNIFKETLISYLGRLNYDFEGKYLLQGSLRRDKYSGFALGNEVGWFPAVSIGWVASKESFIQSLNIINNLKFRASYGETGNNNVGNTINPFISSIESGSNGSINGGIAPGFTLSGANNSDLTWEEAIKQNFGFDLGLFNDKVTFSAEYYKNTNNDLLVPEEQAPSTGISGNGTGGVTVFKNAASVEVDGYEFTAGYNDYEGDFKWSFWGNVTTSESEVIKVNSTDSQLLFASFNPPFSERLTRIASGEPLFHFYGFNFEGVYATDQEVIDHLGADGLDIARGGDARFTDLNADGIINEEDRQVIGNPNPDFTYSANIKAEYKGFDFNALITGVQGADALNSNTFFLEGQVNVLNAGTEVLRRWQNPGDITDVPRFVFGPTNNNAISTRYIEDASYAKLRSVTIGYSLPSKILDHAFDGLVSKFRVYVQGLNLATLTEYSGLDPEIAPFYSGDGLEGLNIDRGSAPQPRTFLLGAQVQF